MRTQILSCALLCSVACAPASATEPDSVCPSQMLYVVSQQGATIEAFEVDAATGHLTLRHEVRLPGNGGPLAVSPDERVVYVAVTVPQESGNSKPAVATFSRARDGALSLLKTAELPAVSPYLRTDPAGNFLLAAHYGAGKVSVLRIVDGICTDELVDEVITAKNAHCVEFDPSGRFVFVPHTGPNRIDQFRFDAATGQLASNTPAFVEGPAADRFDHEPRHVVFHPRLDLAYSSNEKRGGITLWRFDREKGVLSELQNLTALPPGFDGRSAAADIHLTPDARFAYVSNRDVMAENDARQGGDTLTGFMLHPKTGRMESIGQFPTEHFPRSFAIDGTGRYLYAAGQRSHRLVSYRVEPMTGRLVALKTYDVARGPIWVSCLRVE